MSAFVSQMTKQAAVFFTEFLPRCFQQHPVGFIGVNGNHAGDVSGRHPVLSDIRVLSPIFQQINFQTPLTALGIGGENPQTQQGEKQALFSAFKFRLAVKLRS